MSNDKPHVNLVFIGHVDHGKSTTVGRLMFDSGSIKDQKLRKLEEKAEEKGKSGFEFAFVMDNLKEEQERGVTIDLAHKEFDTNNYFFTIIDAPGHKDFVKNMITGASQADVGVLVVSGSPSEGVQAQTKEHVFLAKTMGVDQLIVAVNKMDLADYGEERFEEVKENVSDLLGNVGYDASNIPFIPIASYKGDNVVEESENMDWYEGKTLMDTLDSIDEPETPEDLPLRLPLQDVYKIQGIGTVPVGRIETGEMKVGDDITAVPAREGQGITGEVKSIEMHHEEVPEAGPGDNVGFNVRGISEKDIARGDVIGHTDNPPTVAKEFEAHMIVLNHPSVITVGYTPVFHINSAQVACKITEIKQKMNPSTGEVEEEQPDYIQDGDAAIVKVEPVQPVVIEKQEDVPQLSSFAVRDSGQTVAAGKCIDLTEKELE